MSLLAGPSLTLGGFRETCLLLLKSVLSVELRHSPRSLRHYKLRNALHVHEAFSSANNRTSWPLLTSYAALPPCLFLTRYANQHLARLSCPNMSKDPILIQRRTSCNDIK